MKLHFPLLSTKLNTINQHLDETKYLLVELPIVANFYGKPADLLTWYLNKSKWVSSIYLKVSLIDMLQSSVNDLDSSFILVVQLAGGTASMQQLKERLEKDLVEV